MKVIAVANQKGGVGKTVTSVSLAHGAALHGQRVLLVDLDPQGNCGDSLGLKAGNDLVNLVEIQGRRWIAARENLAVTRSDRATYHLINMLSARDYREGVLEEALEKVSGFDLVIFDCAPSVSVFLTAALFAADRLVIPAQMEDFSIKGIEELLSTLAKTVQKGGACQLGGIIPTFYDRRKTGHEDQVMNLVNQFGRLVWPVIPVDEKVPTSNRYGESLWEAFPRSRAVMGLPQRGGGYGSALDRLFEILK